MLSPSESRRALALVTAAAVADATQLAPLGADAVTTGVPEVIAYYSLGSAALAADHYDDTRLAAGARGRFTAEPIICSNDSRSPGLRVTKAQARSPRRGSGIATIAAS